MLSEPAGLAYVLPVRKAGIPVNLPNNCRKKIISNYYPIELGGNKAYIYQYTFDTEPAVPQDSKDLLHHIIKHVRK